MRTILVLAMIAACFGVLMMTLDAPIHKTGFWGMLYLTGWLLPIIAALVLFENLPVGAEQNLKTSKIWQYILFGVSLLFQFDVMIPYLVWTLPILKWLSAIGIPCFIAFNALRYRSEPIS